MMGIYFHDFSAPRDALISVGRPYIEGALKVQFGPLSSGSCNIPDLRAVGSNPWPRMGL